MPARDFDVRGQTGQVVLDSVGRDRLDCERCRIGSGGPLVGSGELLTHGLDHVWLQMLQLPDRSARLLQVRPWKAIERGDMTVADT
ncbi:MAG: hypothetical protein OXG37_01150 [Actinomycetia bacterium]|nr:hypothetical protein [Actinomycetes bacterium]